MSDQIIFIRGDGNDANTGAADNAGGAKRTIRGAVDAIVWDTGAQIYLRMTTPHDFSFNAIADAAVNATTTGQIPIIEAVGSAKWGGLTEADAEAKARMKILALTGSWICRGFSCLADHSSPFAFLGFAINVIASGQCVFSGGVLRNLGGDHTETWGLAAASGAGVDLLIVNAGLIQPNNGYMLYGDSNGNVRCFSSSVIGGGATGFFAVKNGHGKVDVNGCAVQSINNFAADSDSPGDPGFLTGDYNVTSTVNTSGVTGAHNLTSLSGLFASEAGGAVDFTLGPDRDWQDFVDRSAWAADAKALSDFDATGAARPEVDCDPGCNESSTTPANVTLLIHQNNLMRRTW